MYLCKSEFPKMFVLHGFVPEGSYLEQSCCDSDRLLLRLRTLESASAMSTHSLQIQVCICNFNSFLQKQDLQFMYRPFLCRFREGTSFQNFVERSILKPRKGEEEGWPAKGAKRKKGRVKTGQALYRPPRSAGFLQKDRIYASDQCEHPPPKSELTGSGANPEKSDLANFRGPD